MSLSSSPSPLPKLPFLIADAAFLAAAWFIGASSRYPLSPPAMAGIVVCGAIPFVVEYSRKQEAALDERQRSLDAIARTVSSAAEQVSIAAGGLHEIVEIAQRNLKEAEKLPHRLSEQIAELEAKFSASRDDDREELERELATLRASESERLEATAHKIARAATDWAKAESFGLRHVVAAKTFIAELEQKTATLRAVLASAAPNLIAGVGGARPPGALDVPESPKAPPISEPNAQQNNLASDDPPAQPARPEVALHLLDAKPPPSTIRPVAKKAYDPQEPIPGLDLPDETNQVSPEEASPAASTSADGATRLVVTSYIGIGNRLFIRGEGPGLSWDEGVPLQFVSIGKWRWETPHATEPVKFKLYKNDRDLCPSLATDLLEPGQQQELTATF